MNATNTAPAATITLDQLSADQIKALRKQMAEQRKLRSGDRAAWNTVTDAMLQEKEGDGFAHTTQDILAKLQADKVVASDLSRDDRSNEIKKIQTRKQLLEKKRDDKGNVLFSVGYKPSATGFGQPITIARVEEWVQTEATGDEIATLAKLIKTLLKK